MEYLLKGVDSVLFILDAVDGVRPLTKKFWNLVQAEKLPAVIAINKLDRDRADFHMACDSLQSLGIDRLTLQLPIRENDAFVGYADVLSGKAYLYGPDGTEKETEVPAAIADDLALFRDVTVENIAESDEALMEKYLLARQPFRLEDLRSWASRLA